MFFGLNFRNTVKSSPSESPDIIQGTTPDEPTSSHRVEEILTPTEEFKNAESYHSDQIHPALTEYYRNVSNTNFEYIKSTYQHEDRSTQMKRMPEFETIRESLLAVTNPREDNYFGTPKLENTKIIVSNPEKKARKYGFNIRESTILSSVTRSNPMKTPVIHPALDKWFCSMDTKNEGKITSKELQQAFEIFQGRKFSEAACKFVVRIFDLDKNGGIDVKDFETLYYYIKVWIKAFNTYDREGTGYLGEVELTSALTQMDVHFSPDFIKFLIKRTNPRAKKMSLDQYIVTCIQIQRFTEEFKSRDPEYTGNINIKYEDFLELILRCL